MKKILGLLIVALLFCTIRVNAQEYDLVTSTFNKYSYDKTQVRYLQKELRHVMGCELPTTGNFKSQTLTCLNQFKVYYGLPTDNNGTVDNTVKSYLNYYYLVNRVIVSSTKANIRSTPKVQSGNILGSFTKGNIVKVYGTITANGYTWYKIKYNGVDAFVASTTVKSNFVEVDITAQTLRLYKNAKLIHDTPITTGKADGSHDTNKGFHNVILKQRERILQPSGAYVRYWIRFYNPRALGIHDADWRTENVDWRYFGGTVYKTQGYSAGSKYTGSHGCVNIPVPKMQAIYDNVSVGTVVYVH